MGAEAYMIYFLVLDLDALSYELRHQAANETSQQSKNEALKRFTSS
jgi:DNA-directed RNA polymerase subunit beta'